jgi:para-nitrobenzyl esterase
MSSASHVRMPDRSRRGFLGRSAALVGLTAAGALPVSTSAAKTLVSAAPAADIVRTGPGTEVQTVYGTVAGYVKSGIFTFKGIPYGASTAGSNRFMPPKPPKPWSGVRPSRSYGHTCPQPAYDPPLSDNMRFLMEFDDGIQGEDCLVLNVWTPVIHDRARRPVMVWLHGGGLVKGSCQDLPSYDGENLAHRGDVVVVSLNHRLGAFGFLNLSGLGTERYAPSANVGLLDLVAALKWVRDNIAEFGGDPSNVTVFGQSGGGWKVSALMAMPAAKGLFHKAVIQSGSSTGTLRFEMTQDTSRDLAEAILRELSLGSSQLNELQSIPWRRLVEASWAAQKRLFSGPMAVFRGYAPIADNAVLLPQQPFGTADPMLATGIPILLGTNANELGAAAVDGTVAVSEEELIAATAATFKDKGPAILAAYRRWKPHATPFELKTLLAEPRTDVVRQAQRHAAKGADVYMYLFSWKVPVLDGRVLSTHSSEIAFVFDNVERCVNLTGGGEAARELAAQMSQAWVNFSRRGDPNHIGLPHWPKFEAARGALMEFDTQCVVRDDPDREGRQLIESSGARALPWAQA